MSAPIRLVHIDAEPDYRLLVRLGLESAPEFEMVGDAADVAGGIAVARAHQPALVLVEPLSQRVVDIDGLVALCGAVPDAAVVMLTSLSAADLGGPMVHGRSLGHLSKAVRPTRLATEIRQLLSVLRVVDGAMVEARTELDPDLVSPRRARQFVTETLERWQCQDATAIIDLLVSELVANAVMHAETAAELTVQLLPERVRVSVTDGDPSQPKRRPDDPTVSTGRGIALVERLSLAWGIERVPAGKRIWFETTRPDVPADPDARTGR